MPNPGPRGRPETIVAMAQRHTSLSDRAARSQPIPQQPNALHSNVSLPLRRYLLCDGGGDAFNQSTGQHIGIGVTRDGHLHQRDKDR